MVGFRKGNLLKNRKNLPPGWWNIRMYFVIFPSKWGIFQCYVIVFRVFSHGTWKWTPLEKFYCEINLFKTGFLWKIQGVCAVPFGFSASQIVDHPSYWHYSVGHSGWHSPHYFQELGHGLPPLESSVPQKGSLHCFGRSHFLFSGANWLWNFGVCGHTLII